MIYTPKIYGTCMGSARAIKLSLDNGDTNTYMYKAILHNKDVIDTIKKKGISYTEELNDIPDGSKVILRAHGEGKDLYEYFKKHNIEIIDTTCLNVTKIHSIVESKEKEGFSVLILGKEGHAEILGTIGWTKNGILIEDEKDIDKLKDLNKDILLICQTTINEELFERVSNRLKKKFKDHNIEIVNSICKATEKIQESSVIVAKKVKYMFVLGGEKSSNTRELLNKCSKYTKSYLVTGKSEFLKILSTIPVNKKIDVGFTAGASTIKERVNEYIDIYNFYINYIEFKKRIEKKMKFFNKTFVSRSDNDIVKDSINRFTNLNCDGKYIRSFLINLGYSLNHKDSTYSDYLSLAYETFETSILIHDDIIDNASLRRGKKTIPISYKDDFKIKESIKFGDDIAICLGDYGFYKGNLLLSEKYGKDKNYSKLMSYYNNVVLSTIKGEILDVYLPFNDKYFDKINNLDNILEIYRMKTSWYTITGPFILGLILGGANNSKIKTFEKILEPLGIAFQIKDDILGIFSDTNTIGKDSDDISEYKETILYYYAYNSEYKDELLKLYGRKLNKLELDKLRELFVSSKALEKSTVMMDKLFEEAKNGIDSINIKDEYKSILHGFINYLELREK